MSCVSRSILPFALRALRALRLSAVALSLLSANSAAQSAFPTAGFWAEAEAQTAFGASDFEAGVLPNSPFGFAGPLLKLNEGDGWGGAVALGYVWGNGWSAAVRYHGLKTDDSSGPLDTELLLFNAGGGFQIPADEARIEVESGASMFDIEVAKDIVATGGRFQLFGGLTYSSIERDISVSSGGCGCVPLTVVMANDFRGIGPKIGFRGGVPLTGAFTLVGGGSVAALFGTSTFSSRLEDPLSPPYAFKTDDDRVVAALDGDVGLAVAVGSGNLTFGYRIDAVLGALDTDQRVSELGLSLGFPAIGDQHSDFIEHGPFARLTLPLAVGN